MTSVSTSEAFDVERLRQDFPALRQRFDGHPLVYLDSAATTLKPQPVIDAITRFYERDYANVHRAVHRLAQRATEAYESARRRLQRFVGASAPEEVVFVRGTTEAINLVAQSWAHPRLSQGDEIVVTGLEHHSNIVPWQIVCEQTGARLVVAPVSDDGDVELERLADVLSPRTRLVSVAHVSNALGTVLPVERIAKLAHDHGAPLLVDGAQAAPHLPIDVGALGCDFYALSGHKMYGPTGIGMLWGRRELLEEMPPYQGGGDMIRSVRFEGTQYASPPYRFEAGTQHIAGVVGLGAAVDYLESLGRARIAAHEAEVLAYGSSALATVPGLRLIGTAPHKAAVLSFVMDAAHPHDIGTIVDTEGVAIRTGHHCAQPVMERFGVAATARASLGLYNTPGDIDALVRALARVREIFG